MVGQGRERSIYKSLVPGKDALWSTKGRLWFRVTCGDLGRSCQSLLQTVS